MLFNERALIGREVRKQKNPHAENGHALEDDWQYQ